MLMLGHDNCGQQYHSQEALIMRPFEKPGCWGTLFSKAIGLKSNRTCSLVCGWHSNHTVWNHSMWLDFTAISLKSIHCSLKKDHLKDCQFSSRRLPGLSKCTALAKSYPKQKLLKFQHIFHQAIFIHKKSYLFSIFWQGVGISNHRFSDFFRKSLITSIFYTQPTLMTTYMIEV